MRDPRSEPRTNPIVMARAPRVPDAGGRTPVPAPSGSETGSNDSYVAMTRSAKGAASELRACVELLRMGYYVYRCEAPQAPFDLVAYRDGECFRVEVKSVSYSQYGSPASASPRNDEWDMLLVVDLDRVFQFWYPASREVIRDRIREACGLGEVAEVPTGCVIEGCDKPHRSRGRCQLHYGRFWRSGGASAGDGGGAA